jgi:hypothetical protein
MADNSFVCNICGKEFIRSSNRKKKDVCDACQREINRKKDAEKYARSKSGEATERNYSVPYASNYSTTCNFHCEKWDTVCTPESCKKERSWN